MHCRFAQRDLFLLFFPGAFASFVSIAPCLFNTEQSLVGLGVSSTRKFAAKFAAGLLMDD